MNVYIYMLKYKARDDVEKSILKNINDNGTIENASNYAIYLMGKIIEGHTSEKSKEKPINRNIVYEYDHKIMTVYNNATMKTNNSVKNKHKNNY